MGLNWAEHTVEIEAPIETSFDAIVDYESFPRWQDAIDATEVFSRGQDGLGQEVRLFVDTKVRKIDYVLRYDYTPPTEIRWDFVEGNGMRNMDGVYTLEPLGPERTRATYKLAVDVDLPLPGIVIRRTHKSTVKRSVEDLKTEAERRHSEGESAETATPELSEPAAPADPTAEAPNPRLAEPEPPRPADDWVPKAAREAAADSADEAAQGRGAAAPSSLSLVIDVAAGLAGRVIDTGRSVADGAARAGAEAAEQALEVGRDATEGLIRRINRKLGAGSTRARRR